MGLSGVDVSWTIIHGNVKSTGLRRFVLVC